MNRHRRGDQPDLWVGVLVFMVALAVGGLLCIDDVESSPQPRTWERLR